MSFADEVRLELCQLPTKKPCCRRALTAGLLFGANLEDRKLTTVRYRNEGASALACEMIRSLYAKEPALKKSGACGHTYYDLSFSSPALSKLLWQISQPDADLESLLHFSCDTCHGSFLRGIFLALGTVNDPEKSFHLEFAIPTWSNIEVFSAFLEGQGYPPRRIKRANGTGLYYKDGGSVEDLIGMMGAQHTVFAIMNNRIAREIRNNENRATNCVAKNIEKSISAATRQMDAINKIIENNLLDSLPEPLRATALLRYRNADATLDELVALHIPPISKSGLNHRLQKLQEIADDL